MSQTITLIWDCVAELGLLPDVLVDIVASYAQMSDLRALYYCQLIPHVTSEFDELTFALKFTDPPYDVDYTCTYSGWPLGVARHKGSIDLSSDVTLASVLADCDETMREAQVTDWKYALMQAAHELLTPDQLARAIARDPAFDLSAEQWPTLNGAKSNADDWSFDAVGGRVATDDLHQRRAKQVASKLASGRCFLRL